ncbi:hypothetical protein CYMTET_11696 [Cymbomonas tetramitiformis]|uniref:EF-hand domain-containing protein n=1 Tax=Cymbomonas tetramitiformis TaxID=36881 RepID=A0AAE0LCX3_9CHLO|nr:hypothetical protein CYMTET_11696 [Cymbomonas tetramitiformis]
MIVGYDKEALEKLTLAIFKEYDINGDQNLDQAEFASAISDSRLNLTRKERNLLRSEVDLDKNGKISYMEFLPVMQSLLVEYFKDSFLANKILHSSDNLQQHLFELFRALDTDATGLLKATLVRDMLEKGFEDQKLTRMQVIAIMSVANIDESGRVNYAEFIPTAAIMLHALMDMRNIKKRVDAVKRYSQLPSSQSIFKGMKIEDARQILLVAFQAADADRSGFLEPREVRSILGTIKGKLTFTQEEVNSLLTAVDENRDGRIDYKELVGFMSEVLSHMNREKYVLDSAFFHKKAEMLEEDAFNLKRDNLLGTEVKEGRTKTPRLLSKGAEMRKQRSSPQILDNDNILILLLAQTTTGF